MTQNCSLNRQRGTGLKFHFQGKHIRQCKFCESLLTKGGGGLVFNGELKRRHIRKPGQLFPVLISRSDSLALRLSQGIVPCSFLTFIIVADPEALPLMFYYLASIQIGLAFVNVTVPVRSRRSRAFFGVITVSN
jgi:hypothetical protein